MFDTAAASSWSEPYKAREIKYAALMTKTKVAAAAATSRVKRQPTNTCWSLPLVALSLHIAVVAAKRTVVEMHRIK